MRVKEGAEVAVSIPPLPSLDAQARTDLRREVEALPIPVIKQKIGYLSKSPDALKPLVGLMKSELIDVFVNMAMESGMRATTTVSFSAPSSVPTASSVSQAGSLAAPSAAPPTHHRRRSDLPSGKGDSVAQARVSPHRL